MASISYRNTLQELTYDIHIGNSPFEETDEEYESEEEFTNDHDEYLNHNTRSQLETNTSIVSDQTTPRISSSMHVRPSLIYSQAFQNASYQNLPMQVHEVSRATSTEEQSPSPRIATLSPEIREQLEAIYCLEGVPDDDFLWSLSDHLQLGIITLQTWFRKRHQQE